MRPVVLPVLRAAPSVAVLVRALLVRDIEYKAIPLNLKQLFPSPVDIPHPELCFQQHLPLFALLAVPFSPAALVTFDSRRIQIGSEARLQLRVSEAHWGKKNNKFLNRACICFISGQAYFISHCMYIHPLQAAACVCRFIAPAEMGVVCIMPIFQEFLTSAFLPPSRLHSLSPLSLFCYHLRI